MIHSNDNVTKENHDSRREDEYRRAVAVPKTHAKTLRKSRTGRKNNVMAKLLKLVLERSVYNLIRLRPPAAETSRARLACSCPCISAKSVTGAGTPLKHKVTHLSCHPERSRGIWVYRNKCTTQLKSRCFDCVLVAGTPGTPLSMTIRFCAFLLVQLSN